MRSPLRASYHLLEHVFPQPAESASAIQAERRSWLALWLPAAPVLGVLIGLTGWAVMEPENAERLSVYFYVALAPALTIALRALIRAARSVAVRAGQPLAATVGLLSPRVVLSDRLRDALDRRAFEAARRHEMAHAAHFDPLRIWLARLVTDLRWPGKTARRHYLIWREFLEMARDEEVVRSGIDGTDLAAAILAAARLASPTQLVTGLLAPEASLEKRVRLLLGSLGSEAVGAKEWRVAVLVGGLFVLSITLGAGIGEAVLERFFLA